MPRDALVEAVTRILTLKFRSPAARQPDLATLGSPEHQQAVAAVAAAAITVLRGRCGGRWSAGRSRVTAPAARDRAGHPDQGVAGSRRPVAGAGGTVIHLVGYGDNAADLDQPAAVTVTMDTPYLLAASRSPTLLAIYSSSRLSLTRLAAVLAGKARPPGRSPGPVAGLPRTAC